MNGVPELLVLRLLRNGEMYGYQIVQAIREETGEVVSLGEGVVYPVLHALERGGAISSRRRAVNGRSRIYYSLSPKGASRLTELTALWSRVTGAVQQVLTGDGHAGLV
jgi:PadR family transcriptional regulator PadR